MTQLNTDMSNSLQEALDHADTIAAAENDLLAVGIIKSVLCVLCLPQPAQQEAFDALFAVCGKSLTMYGIIGRNEN